MAGVVLRAAVEADIPSINAIYRYYVTNSTCVWTTDLPTNEDRLHWFRTCSVPTPVLVAELDGRVVGWGALSWFETAATFYRVVEDSLYVHHDYHRFGIGRRLLRELIQCAGESRITSIIALISADQAASIALHKSEGFEMRGRFVNVGFKFQRWHDAVYMQLPLARNMTGIETKK